MRNETPFTVPLPNANYKSLKRQAKIQGKPICRVASNALVDAFPAATTSQRRKGDTV